MGSQSGTESAVVTGPALLDPTTRSTEAESAAGAPAGGTTARAGSLEAALRDHPTSFGFFQAVRLLQQLHPERGRVGLFIDPADEVVRFSVQPSISFPPSEIHSLLMPADGRAQMSVNFLGLTGPQGVLPHAYTQLIAERKRARDHAMGEFLDLFHHRMLSLFYRAWEKYRFTVQAEGEYDDRLSQHLLDLTGTGLGVLRSRLSTPIDALLFYAGLMLPEQRSAHALEQVIEAVFDVSAEIEQFVGAWYSLPQRDQCVIGDENDASTQLGLGAVVGDEVWDQQGRVRIRLGPLTRQQFNEFLPTGSAYPMLQALTRFFSHDQFEFELQLVLAKDEVPGFVIGAAEDEPQPLGWSTWIRTKPRLDDAQGTVLTL
jgi:type VI secretion system protein ImpH